MTRECAECRRRKLEGAWLCDACESGTYDRGYRNGHANGREEGAAVMAGIVAGIVALGDWARRARDRAEAAYYDRLKEG
jgi:hypothetical protein